jgi:hypothetical protein
MSETSKYFIPSYHLIVNIWEIPSKNHLDEPSQCLNLWDNKMIEGILSYSTKFEEDFFHSNSQTVV